MKRFLLCAVALAGLMILSPAIAAGKKAAKTEKPGEIINIKELYSITPASAPSEEEFKATPVELPPDMHVGVSADPFAMEMGNVTVNPIPNRVKD